MCLSVSTMKLIFISLILTTSLYVVQCEAPIGSNQEFDHDTFEKESPVDQNQDATMFGNGEQFGSQDKGNFFMYQHVPKKDHYEFSYRRGNDHHVKEHHEKAAPHEGHFKIQARWGDKHGGYGEHYWDYNHGGDSQDEGAANEEINAEFSRNVQSPSVIPPSSMIDAQSAEVSETPVPKIKSSYRKQKSIKYSKKPKYEEIGNRRPQTYEKSTENAASSSTDPNVFIIPPKSLADSTSIYSFEDQSGMNSGSNDPTYAADLYDQLKHMPNAYNEFEENYSSSPATKIMAKYRPPQRSHYPY